MSKPANHKVKRARCSVEHPGLLIIAARGHARHLLQYQVEPSQYRAPTAARQLGVGSRTATPARST